MIVGLPSGARAEVMVTREKETNPEADPRFPGGPWTGFFLQKEVPGRHTMELQLQFSEGLMRGEGRDWVGEFLIRGRYEIEDGSCRWSKQYIDQHLVFYKGFNEGKGIWGTWELDVPQFSMKFEGGFHIWPEGMPDPTGVHLAEAVDVPVSFESGSEIEDNILVP